HFMCYVVDSLRESKQKIDSRSESTTFVMPTEQMALSNLAAAFLAGAWSLRGLVRRGAEACGQRQRWLRSLAKRVLSAVGEDRPDESTLVRFLDGDPSLQRVRDGRGIGWRRLFWVPGSMTPSPWRVPALASQAALAEWLHLTPAELSWFADLQGRNRHAPP